jgi:hypothetical protein
MTMLFAALHESGCGTKRTYRGGIAHVRFGGRSGLGPSDGEVCL